MGTNFVTWDVPAFLMISGMLLLKPDKTITYQTCLKKYIKRILLALFIFGIPFSCMEIFMDTRKVSFSMFPKSVLNVITGNSWDHLWYLYTLIGIYLFLPVIKAFTDTCSKETFQYVLAVLFVFNLCIPIFNQLWEIEVAFELPVKTIHLFYFLMGKYLDDELPPILRKKKTVLLGIAITLFAKVIFCKLQMAYEDVFHNDLDRILTMALTILIFSALKGVSFKKINSQSLWRADRLCFGVYIIHPVFIHFFYKFLKISPISFEHRWAVASIGFWVLFTICSFFTSWVMSQIKPLKKYVL